MTQNTPPETTTSVDWLLDDMVSKADAQHAVLLSADGLVKSYSRGLGQDDAEAMAAVASGVQSLARSAGERFGGGPVHQTIIEMRNAFLLVTVAGEGACLAVQAAADADVSLVAYEVNMTVSRVDEHLKTSPRSAATGSGSPTSS